MLKKDLFIKDGEVQDEVERFRWGQSVALPGLLRAMETVLKNYGTMTLKQVAAPAIKCAREGFGTSFTGALTMEDDSVQRKIRLSKTFQKLFLKADGSYYKFGEKQTNPKIAALLERVAEEGTDAFYTGTIAKKWLILLMHGVVVLH